MDVLGQNIHLFGNQPNGELFGGEFFFVLFVVTFFTSVILSVIGILLIIKACAYFKLYDQPDWRKVHTAPVPRLGGAIFLPVSILGLCAALYSMEGLDYQITISLSTFVMGIGSLIVYTIGLLDDRFGIKAFHKFIFQVISALFLPLLGLLITDLNGIFGIHEIPIWVGYPLTVILIMTIVNAINLIDGIDGLASGLCIFILSAYAYIFFLSGHATIVALDIAIVGSLLVFWCFNVFGHVGHHKLFMGDSGSLFLGYVCAYMSIKSLMRPIAPVDCGEEQMLISVTLLLIPVLDVVRVAFQRKLSGRSIFEPDKIHIHHIFMSAGLSMHMSLACIIAMFLVICGINYSLWQANFPLPIILLLDVLIYAFVVAVLIRLEQNDEK